MLWFLSILFLLVASLLYFLFAPFYLEIDSRNGLFRFRFHKLASARIYMSGDSINLNLKIFRWQKIFDLFAGRKTSKVSGKVKITKTRRKITLRQLLAIIKSFKINQFYINIDTGSMYWNGIIYPIFLYGIKGHRNIMINFRGENEILIQIENNAFRLLRSYILNK